MYQSCHTTDNLVEYYQIFGIVSNFKLHLCYSLFTPWCHIPSILSFSLWLLPSSFFRYFGLDAYLNLNWLPLLLALLVSIVHANYSDFLHIKLSMLCTFPLRLYQLIIFTQVYSHWWGSYLQGSIWMSYCTNTTETSPTMLTWCGLPPNV